MEEINIKEVLEFYISKLRILIFITLLVVLAGATYSLVFQKPEYEAMTTLVLTGTTDSSGTSGSDQTVITQNDITLNSKLVATYREVIKSKTVLKEVINNLDLDYTVKELNNMIKVASVAETEMISISVQGMNAPETAKIANELADVFSLKIVDIYNIDNISIIDMAEVPTIPINVNIVKQIVIYFLVGFVLASALVFVMFYFDTTLKDKNQIEKIGLNILCSVPLSQDDGGKRR
ncbi:MAG: Wzz/FepE/Etk N-terminal domain-containing protein [Clostridia bacterium]|nr:Wzz/FepE/Etk N-terminal domain-containing protein [Clostridia bacterium]MDD4375353.1 Wzz/FepE/Etk N-terminal domain-containing protein [Clostridia bacterium]